MPWGNNGQGGGGQGPWGNGNRGGGNDNTPTPPDFDKFFKKGKDQFGSFFGGGKKPLLFIGFVVLMLWMSTGFYTVDTGEQGVVLRFGKYNHWTGPGLHYRLPMPIDQIIKVPVERNNRIEIGVRTGGGNKKIRVPEESLMLTGDENITDVQFEIQWKISSAKDFLFNLRDPAGTVKAVAESAMREVVGQTPAEKALSEGKSDIEQKVNTIMQTMLDEYGAGIYISRVKLGDVQMPERVSAAYKDVQNAKLDYETAINQAEAYRNDILPRARGEAEQLIQNAEGYKAQIVAAAEGNAARFLSVYGQYKNAKDVTKERMYLETMEGVLQGVDKILLDQPNGNGVVPYLPLNELKKK